MNLLKNEDAEFRGENWIARKLNVLNVKQSMCKNGLFSPSWFTDGREAESTFGMVTRRFVPWRLYTSAECASLVKLQTDYHTRGMGLGQSSLAGQPSK